MPKACLSFWFEQCKAAWKCPVPLTTRGVEALDQVPQPQLEKGHRTHCIPNGCASRGVGGAD